MFSTIIYQMGKVGSSSIKYSLEKSKLNPLHIHRYYITNIETSIGINPRLLFSMYRKKIFFFYLIKFKKVKIISFYRDPIKRNISSFFQNLKFYFSKNELKKIQYNDLEKKFNQLSNIHQTPNLWFHSEFNSSLNLDIFNHTFNKEKGFKIIKEKNIEIFICRTDKINLLSKELGAFLEIDNFEIINTNIGSQKWYKDLYLEFKENYVPSKEMINFLYDSDTCNYFFTINEINEMKNIWA